MHENGLPREELYIDTGNGATGNTFMRTFSPNNLILENGSTGLQELYEVDSQE